LEEVPLNVLVDTPIWSLALRRQRKALSAHERVLSFEFSDLVKADRVVVIGPIRQELLTGIRNAAAFDGMCEYLRAFDDEPLVGEDFEDAARCANRCLAEGVIGSNVDLLICSVALRRGLAIFTTDADFERYRRVLPIQLHALAARRA
jgi:predicted nucleic acid-binding protein